MIIQSQFIIIVLTFLLLLNLEISSDRSYINEKPKAQNTKLNKWFKLYIYHNFIIFWTIILINLIWRPTHKSPAAEENPEKLISQLLLTLDTPSCPPPYRRTSEKSTGSNHFQWEKMMKSSSWEEIIKDTRAKSSKYSERSGLFTLISLPKIKPMELHIKSQSTHQRSPSPSLNKVKTEWQE